MLAKITTLTSADFFKQGGFGFDLKESTEYIINTNNITDLKVYGTTDSELNYLFAPGDNRTSRMILRVDEAYSVIVGVAQSDAVNRLIAVSVIEDEFGDVITSTTYYVNQDQIVLADTYKTGYTKLFINNGGSDLKTLVVSETLAQLITLADA
jgi:hypothetical protein